MPAQPSNDPDRSGRDGRSGDEAALRRLPAPPTLDRFDRMLLQIG